MKLFHAADLHLDTPMRGLVAYEDAPLEDLRFATRRALANLVDAAIEEEADLLLLAGDVFDGDWAHWNTGVAFVAEMGRLREAEIPVVMVSGNHDAASKLTKSVKLPANVKLLASAAPETASFEQLGLAVHGQGYATPAILENLSAGYPKPRSDLLNVGLLHTCADGRPGHERYAPCSLDDLLERGYDYWALGHVHRREVLNEDPPVLFPGNLQGRGIRETGPKGATVVELAQDGSAEISPRVLDCVRWERLRVDASGCGGTDEVAERIGAEMRAALDAVGERLLAVRVVLEGATDVHHSLARDREQLRYEAIAAAADVAGQQIWVERVDLATKAPRELAHGGDDALGELVRELESLATEEGVAEMQELLAPLADVLPPEVRLEFDPGDPETVSSLLAEVADSLPSRLLGGGEG
jgi:DNA repair exonuclease SbcCD nuclease subunit